MNYVELEKASREDTSQITNLLNQLRSYSVTDEMISTDVKDVVADKNRAIIVARNPDIVGIAVVNIVIKLGKKEARIDEVVVDESTRGGGVGQKLMRTAIDWAWSNGCISIELTSKPGREAANKLYQKLGFEIRKTNVYQLKKSS